MQITFTPSAPWSQPTEPTDMKNFNQQLLI